MPELPEVETVCRGLAIGMVGRRFARVLLRRPDLRFPMPPDLALRLEGRRIEAVTRRAKYILVRTEDDGVLLAHLGMSGRMVLETGPGDGPGVVAGPHDHVILSLDDGTVIRFNDARRFGMLDYVAASALDSHRLLAGIGPEPLSDDFTGPVLAAALAGKMTSIKAALLDQKIVAGLGNIYVSESLYYAGLSPKRLAATVTGARAGRLVAAIKDVLSRAVAAGGSSLRDYVQASGELGFFQHQWAVYGKEGQPCPACDCREGIRRLTQSGRSTFYCARRQR